jgi:hypothetical protein
MSECGLQPDNTTTAASCAGINYNKGFFTKRSRRPAEPQSFLFFKYKEARCSFTIKLESQNITAR